MVYEAGKTDTKQNRITVPISSLMTDHGLVFVIPESMYRIDKHEVEFSDFASQMLRDCVDSNSTPALYDEDQIPTFPLDENLLPSELHETSATEPEEREGKKGKGKKRKMTVIESDSETEENIDVNNEDKLAVGQWAVCMFEFGTKINYYLGQIVGTVDNEEEKRRFQFYREEIPNCSVFLKLNEEEDHDVNAIVETVPKSAIDFICGTKIKIMGYNLQHNCV